MKIKSIFIKKIYNISSKINNDIYMYLDENQVTFQSILDGNGALSETIVDTECKKYGKTIVFPLKSIKNILSILADDDDITFETEDEYLKINAKKLKRRIRLIQPEKPRFILPDERKDEPLKFTHSIETFTSLLKNAITAGRDIEGNINLTFDKTGLIVNKENKTDLFSYDIKKNDIKISKSGEKITNMYNEEYLLYFLSNVDGKINIDTIKSGPIKLVTKPIKDLTAKYMVAPLVENERE